MQKQIETKKTWANYHRAVAELGAGSPHNGTALGSDSGAGADLLLHSPSNGDLMEDITKIHEYNNAYHDGRMDTKEDILKLLNSELKALEALPGSTTGFATAGGISVTKHLIKRIEGLYL